MLADGNTSISEEEAALYDRQIRLWGVDAQNKLKNAKLLLIGMTPLASEISKNLVLAGVAALTIVDDATATEDDSLLNFLISSSSIGLNRASAALARLQALNPMVKVNNASFVNNAEKIRISKGYDVIIIADDLKTKDLVDWFSVREESVKIGGIPQLFYVLAVGCFGVSIVDLGTHSFLAEDVITKKRADSRKSDGVPVVPSAATETVYTKKCVTYPNFQLMWEQKSLTWLNKRVSKGFLLTQLIHRCDASEAPFDLEYLISQWQLVASELKVDECLLAEDDLKSCCGPVVPAVGAVLGGVVSQEVIRAITGRGTPHGNWYHLNGIQCSVTVSWIPTDALFVSQTVTTC